MSLNDSLQAACTIRGNNSPSPSRDSHHDDRGSLSSSAKSTDCSTISALLANSKPVNFSLEKSPVWRHKAFAKTCNLATKTRHPSVGQRYVRVRGAARGSQEQYMANQPGSGSSGSQKDQETQKGGSGQTSQQGNPGNQGNRPNDMSKEDPRQGNRGQSGGGGNQPSHSGSGGNSGGSSNKDR